MWDGRLEEGDFASLQQFITGLDSHRQMETGGGPVAFEPSKELVLSANKSTYS